MTYAPHKWITYVLTGIMCLTGIRGRRMEPSPLGSEVHWESDHQWNHSSISEGEDSSTMFQSVHADFKELHTWSRHPTTHNGWYGGKAQVGIKAVRECRRWEREYQYWWWVYLLGYIIILYWCYKWWSLGY